MSRLRSPEEIRRILETDRIWSAYALADLAPAAFERCEWHGTTEPPALVLLYRGFSVPVLLAVGTEDALVPILEALPREQALYLSVPGHVPGLLERWYAVREIKRMVRMWLPPAAALPALPPGIETLGPADMEAIVALYGDGVAAGEAPEFFDAGMLSSGVYRGVRTSGALVAVAGTHVLHPGADVAAIGNVYVKRSERGAGLGAAVTCAVAASLRASGVGTIVLNVAEANVPARRAYDRLGFRVHVPYFEGRVESLP